MKTNHTKKIVFYAQREMRMIFLRKKLIIFSIYKFFFYSIDFFFV